MSSTADSRSSSAVRNLRSIFENKASESSNFLSPDSRGRSPSGVGSDKENGGAKNKVRASFVAVEPAIIMSAPTTQKEVMEVVDSLAASAIAPMNMPNAALPVSGAKPAEKIELAPANPDKPTTGSEEEPGAIKPADLSNASAVSGGEALPPVAEDLRPSAQPATAIATKKTESKQPTAPASKPPSISTKPAAKPAASSVKSPVSKTKTPTSASSDSPATKRAARSSLTAPTAASVARAEASEKPNNNKTSPIARPKPREVTKPVNISSHLTAPTASSKAKLGPEGSSAPILRTTLAHRPKHQTSAAKSRPSLGAAPRPPSRDSSHSARRSLAPVDGSFLDRMTRPTAASANRVSEKVEAKSPSSKAKTAPRPKVNGVTKASAVTKSTSQEVSAAELSADPPAAVSVPPELPGAGRATTAEDSATDVDRSGPAGSETPVHTNGDANPALEATPAGLAVDDTIR